MNHGKALYFLLSCTLVSVAFGCGKDDAADSDAGGDEQAVDDAMPPAKFLPKVTGTCPGFAKDDGCEQDDESLICTFQPDMVAKPRKVRIYVSAAADEKDGPIVVYWHGLGAASSNVTLVGLGFGPDIVQEILDGGGIVISPEKEDGRSESLQNLPWIQAATGQGPDDDLLVMDEAIACVIEKYGADLRRIYSTGMSAGALQTGRVVIRRSGYIASAAIFSGGMPGLPDLQDPSNKLPVAIFYGGDTDIIAGLHFANNVPDMRRRLEMNKQFSIVCNHDMGHSLPATAAVAGWQFLKDHPYGRKPEPYAKGLPKSFPDYCEL